MAEAVGSVSGVSKIKGGRWTVGKFFLLGVCRPPSNHRLFGSFHA